MLSRGRARKGKNSKLPPQTTITKVEGLDTIRIPQKEGAIWRKRVWKLRLASTVKMEASQGEGYRITDPDGLMVNQPGARNGAASVQASSPLRGILAFGAVCT